MLKISELRHIVGGYFTWNKSRLDCFLEILVGLFMVRTVNLREIALAMETPAKIESRYRRLKAFFTQFTPNYFQIACWVMALFVNEQQKIYLTIDRTNWYFGKSKINAFVLAIAHEGVAIPLHWTLLNKAGSTTADEQIALVQWFVDRFGIQNIQGLLADREFANKRFFEWLIKNKIPFYIRIKENTQIRLFKCSKHSNLKKLFQSIPHNNANYYPYSILIFGLRLNVAAGRSPSGELLIVVTQKQSRNAISFYLRRWEIECLFASLKTKGFNFEDTHLTDPYKLSKLIAILAVGTAWAIKVGEWRASKEPIRFNQHRESIRPQYSYFRYGLDFIRDTLLNMGKKLRKLRQCLQAITITSPQKYFVLLGLAWH